MPNNKTKIILVKKNIHIVVQEYIPQLFQLYQEIAIKKNICIAIMPKKLHSNLLKTNINYIKILCDIKSIF